jgi:hypothetical protein
MVQGQESMHYPVVQYLLNPSIRAARDLKCQFLHEHSYEWTEAGNFYPGQATELENIQFFTRILGGGGFQLRMYSDKCL